MHTQDSITRSPERQGGFLGELTGVCGPGKALCRTEVLHAGGSEITPGLRNQSQQRRLCIKSLEDTAGQE